jgi:hypothetical protein
MKEVLMLILGCLFGSISTFWLQKNGCSAVVASASVGLIGALAGHLLQISDLPAVIFAGSFVGMTGDSVGSYTAVSLGGIVAGLIYSVSLSIFAGFGGRLGTIAFISTVSSFYLLKLAASLFN